MESDTCAEFVTAIQRNFEYLFRQYNFEITLSRPASADGERCLVILSSDQCRMKFIYNRGDVEFTVGTLAAPMNWDDFVNGRREWYSPQCVLDFLRREKCPSLEDLLRAIPFRTLEEKLARLSADLRFECPAVIRFFHEEGFAARRVGLDEYLREQSECVRRQIDARTTERWAYTDR